MLCYDSRSIWILLTNRSLISKGSLRVLCSSIVEWNLLHKLSKECRIYNGYIKPIIAPWSRYYHDVVKIPMHILQVIILVIHLINISTRTHHHDVVFVFNGFFLFVDFFHHSSFQHSIWAPFNLNISSPLQNRI